MLYTVHIRRVHVCIIASHSWKINCFVCVSDICKKQANSNNHSHITNTIKEVARQKPERSFSYIGRHDQNQIEKKNVKSNEKEWSKQTKTWIKNRKKLIEIPHRKCKRRDRSGMVQIVAHFCTAFFIFCVLSFALRYFDRIQIHLSHTSNRTIQNFCLHLKIDLCNEQNYLWQYLSKILLSTGNLFVDIFAHLIECVASKLLSNCAYLQKNWINNGIERKKKKNKNKNNNNNNNRMRLQNMA